MQKRVGSYKAMETAGKTVPELVARIYEGLIIKFRDAAKLNGEKKYTEASAALDKARNTIVYLYSNLDMDKGGEVAENLGRLYAYLVQQIDLVKATKNAGTINDSIEILENIKGGWTELADRMKKKSDNAPGAETPQCATRLSVSV